ncbi:ABC transporter ATP-binding protein [Fructilactobacillus fructivorans]|uniref:Multidrug resistance ABC transporter ATP-binding and permease protein n=1 Tax=Fructilactobacillus fructivorans TaxID=1614 RepID=A0AAE6TWX5_9LACO|nr:ABC transporter ATP-binding protein [Fructilactobacillus fructivorans]KRK57504.1 ABC-type multidrug transport system, ATPase and permease component [Fructilactobacillus fructivorans]KRN39900.1 ABC-type multidrug transport system, ATPase and permease component [Fructilactobacillus fructivorans]QFX93179.1 ATP-binding cassette domain-containing protein [Fructilactobacillus fructivorans]RDV64795.1 ABC transporter ATP-binding protein [Fructilactobacillus fructivorans]
MKKQAKNNGSFNFRGFFHLIRETKPRYWQLVVGLLLGLIATGAQLTVPKIAQVMVNDFAKGVSLLLVSAMIVLFILSALINAGSGTLLGFFGENVVANLRELLWEKMVKLNVHYFDSVKTGKMISRLVSDSDQIKDLLSVSFPNTITSIFQLIGALIIMLIMDWRMALIMFIAIPIVMVVMRPIIRKSSQIGKSRQDQMADFSGKAQETLNEIRLVKSSNAEPYETKAGSSLIHNLYRVGLKESVYDSIAGPILNTVMMAMIVGILAYGAHRVAIGAMTIGTMFAFLMYLFQIIGPVSMLGRFITDLSKANGSTEHVRELLTEPEEDFASGFSDDIGGKTLRLNDVSFAYDLDEPVLKNVNVVAKPNQTTAFVGPSGGGKSTIFSLIERYYQPTSGTLTIGNENIDDINLSNWRHQIGLVSQDSAIMAGTIRHNLTYGLNEKFTDDQLWHVLSLAYAEGFVKEMPEGLSTQVGERGIKVSGGQRQRLAIARAFLRDPKILMLDEATASLDSQSEAMVQKALGQLMKGRTTLIIAHRLSTIVDSDDIYFVDHGEISGHGTHEELIKKLPKYREYVKIQFKK